MFGRITIEPAQRRLQTRTALEPERLYGASFLLGRAFFLRGDSEERRRRILLRLFRRMARAGVVRVVPPPAFLYERELRAAGLVPFDTLRLYRAVAPQLALRGLEQIGVAPERAAVSLSGTRMDRSLWRAAFSLCPRVRYLIVDVDDAGGAILRRRLHDCFGIPSLSGSASSADFTLFYQPKEAAPPAGAGFLLCPGAERYPARPRLYREAHLALPPGFESLPRTSDNEALLSALCELGAVRADDLTAERLLDGCDIFPDALTSAFPPSFD